MQGSHILIAPGHVQVTGDVNHTHSLPKAVQGVDVVVSALQVSTACCSLCFAMLLPPIGSPGAGFLLCAGRWQLQTSCSGRESG